MAARRSRQPTGKPGRPRGATRANLPARKPKSSPGVFDNDRAAKRFLEAVLEHVPYSQFIDLEPALMVDEYLTLRNLALIDRFWGWSDEEIKMKLGYEPLRLAQLRAHVHYEKIKQALVEKAVELAAPASMETWAKRVEDRAAMEVFLMSVSDIKSHKDRLTALESFLDRTSAKKGRDPEEGRGLTLPADFIQTIRFALEMQGNAAPQKQIGNGGGTISADVLGVPPTKHLTTGAPGNDPKGKL